ncbi:hypothetical protein PCH_Pc22g27100 [Penicillium rubens Wisconsin 54-1255]|uniref:Uncharacterized protein n=1 Tax=Penicillium rubens (strain ATCC 28089 / DSM 1075 / NRRL 1951 / Wisconsin 54-1255) TaxID=500485 RepID=B6HUR7_PENRW|nr:hypothetical protein PCH_Pc22g27100 [Penicillium rubens Wisconsin 54-1255]
MAKITRLSGNRQPTVAKYSCVLRLPVIPFGLLGLDLKTIGTLSNRRLGCTSIRKCLQMMSIVEEEIQKAQEEREEERHKLCQLLEQLQAEKADETSKLQLAIAARDAALADGQRVRQEICELQQQLESTNAALQDQVPWNDIQLGLDQARGDMVSTTTRFWNTIDALQNRRLASYLPGSGVIHADCAEQSGPVTQGHDALLSLSESNVPLPSQQEPSTSN